MNYLMKKFGERIFQQDRKRREIINYMKKMLIKQQKNGDIFDLFDDVIITLPMGLFCT